MTVAGERAALIVTGAGAVVTMDASRRVLTGSAIVIRDGRIAEIGPQPRLLAANAGLDRIDAAGGVVTPGLIDAHQHLTGDRLARSSIPDTVPSWEAITRWAIPLHAAQDAQDEALAAGLACVEAARNGVTTVVEAGTVANPERVAAAVAEVGIRAGIGVWGWDVGDGPHAAPAAVVLDRARRVLDAFPAGAGLVEGWVALVGHDLASDELLRGAAELARGTGTRMTMHMSANERDGERYRARTGVAPLVHLDRLGVLGPHLLLAHALHTDAQERELLLGSRTAVAMCPWAYLRLGQDPQRIRWHAGLVARGVRAALGCDSENAGDQIDVLRTAALLAGWLDPAGSRAEAAFALATCAGAEAIGRDHDLGSIEVGKQADLVIFDAGHSSWVPAGSDPYLQLVWGTDGRSVRDVLVAGRVVVRDGRCTMVDEHALAAEAGRRAAALRARAGIPTGAGTWTAGRAGGADGAGGTGAMA